MKYLSVLLLCLPLIAIAGPNVPIKPVTSNILNLATERKLFDDNAVLIAEGYSKVCRKGKSHGNSCVSRSYIFHKWLGGLRRVEDGTIQICVR